MSHLRRIWPPEGDRSPCAIMMEELSDVFAILRLLSERIARLEAKQTENMPRDDD